MALCGDSEKLIHRLNRIEGQVKGLRKMVEEDRDCFDVLKQVAATSGAMHSLGMVILEYHLTGCVSKALRDQTASEDMINQIIDIFNKFSK